MSEPIYAIEVVVPFESVQDDDEIIDATLGDGACVRVRRDLDAEGLMRAAGEGCIVNMDGDVLRVSPTRVLRKCASGQVHIEVRERW